MSLLNIMGLLDGKVALITGAARGIGKAIAMKFASEGADVAFTDLVINEVGEQTVKDIEAFGHKVKAYASNAANFEETHNVVNQILADFGRIDILVNNAGITKDNLIMKMSEDDFDAVIATNLKGAFNCIKHVSRQMLKQKGGRIINISSVSGVMGNAGQANYCASKAGVIGLTKSVARELSSRGITCNAVAPGFIDTEMTAQMTDKAKEAVKTQIPLGRVGKVDDIAEVVTFLASEKASYITGQVISVDGGMSI